MTELLEHMPALSALQWAGYQAGALLVGFTKTGVPGLGPVVVPLMATVFPARASTGLLLPLLLAADLFAVVHYRRHAVWPHLWRLLPWAAAGIVAGWLVLGRINDRQLEVAIGAIVLVIVALGLLGGRWQARSDAMARSWWWAGGLGLAAGFTTMISNAAGPIMVIYLLAMRLPKREFVGTGAWYYLTMNLLKVPFSASLGLITGPTLLLNATALPAIAAGAWLGIAALERIPERGFNTAMQVLAAAAAVNLLL
ncbi:MAG: sulfite exporter TauE/SafE family protein [Spirochaetaceae bacterium]|nr:sulfite exporter TauE/SafE family protein [Spirochaetaceae bacterium]